MFNLLLVLFCLALGLGQQTQPVQQFDAPYRLEPIERFAGQLWCAHLPGQRVRCEWRCEHGEFRTGSA